MIQLVETAFGFLIGKLEFDLAEPSVVHVDLNAELIFVLVTLGVVALALAVDLHVDLVPVLVDLDIDAGDVGQRDHVRVGGGGAALSGHAENAGVAVDVDLGIVAQRLGGTERLHLGLVGLSVRQMLFHLGDGGPSAVGQPRGNGRGAFLAHIAVFQLPVAQKADLFTAEITEFLFKQCHNVLLFC